MLLSWSKINDPKSINLIEYIDENALYFKNKYNDLLNNYNELISLNIKLNKLLSFNKIHNFNDYSLINERSFYKSPNITNVLKYLAFQDIILKNKKKIITLILDDKNIYNYFINTNIHNNCLFELHEKNKNIKIFKTNTIKEFLKTFVLFTKIIILKFFRLFKNKYIKSDITFISYFDNFSLKSNFKSNYWSQIIDYISQYKKYNFIHIENNPFSFSDKLKNNKLLNKINTHNNNQSYLLFDYLKIFDLFKIFVITIKVMLFVNLKSFKINNNLTNEINALNYFLKDDIVKSYKGSHLLENLIYIYSFQNLSNLIVKKNHSIFYLFENQSWEKIMKNTFVNSNIYGFIHSTVRFWDLRYTADTSVINNNKKFFILNSGEGSKKILKLNNINLNKLINVESLRYLKYKKIQKKIYNNKILICNYPSSAIIDFYLLNKKVITYYNLNDVNTNPLYLIEKSTYFSDSVYLTELLNNKSHLIKNTLSKDFLYLNADIEMWKNFLKTKNII